MTGPFRRLVERVPGLQRAARRLYYTKHNLRDVYDQYVSRPTKAEPTPLGFQLGGLTSQHHRAMQAGTFEVDETRLLISLIPKVDAFVDVGANVGYYTCLARSLGKPAIAIEPLANNLKCLMANLAANAWNDTEVFPIGVSSKPGLVTLFGASSTGASLVEGWAGSSSLFRRHISVSTLDTIIGDRFRQRRLLIKVDVEGHEYDVLRGAAGLLAAAVKPIWFIEIALNEFHPSGKNPHFVETFDLLWARGYAALLLKHGALVPVSREQVVRWATATRTDSPEFNYLFMPPDLGPPPVPQ
jgi:FkbM family methyltransferase